ncbi:hypothetical protein L6R53_19185 [Myxococcota bacterium]|nr:hypothetical protein [Myxococcota bacterium]
MLALLLLAPAHAGPTALLTLGLGLPLDSPHRSTPGPAAGVLLGWRLQPADPAGAFWAVQPELGLRFNMGAPVLTVPLGTSVTWGGAWRAGASAHLGPTLLGYPWPPAAQAGLVGEWDPPSPFTMSLRSGWELANAAHVKCGDCPQPADHWATFDLLVGVSW